MTDNEPVDSGLTRAYATLPQDAPPAHLDAAILDAARREAGAQPRKRAFAFPLAWRLPFAVAAVVVLSVSIVTLMMEEDDERMAGSPVPAPPPAQTFERKAPTAPPEAVRQRAQLADQAKEVASSGERPPAAERPKARRADRGVAERERAREPVVVEAKKAESAPERRVENTAGDLGAEDVAPAAAAPAPAAAPLAKAPAAATVTEERERASALGSAGPAARTGRLGEAKPGTATQDDLPAAVRQLIRDLDLAPPEKWLEKIRALRREGRDADAEAVLAEFRKRFPEHAASQQEKR